MSRDVPYSPDDVCDICGTAGAYDFYGDIICSECFDKASTDKSKKKNNKNEITGISSKSKSSEVSGK